MSFRGARPDADTSRRIGHGSTGGDKGGEDIDLTGGPSRRWGAAQVPVPHANRLPAAAIYSSRPSIGIR
jgi:hypothetical protein